MMMMIAGSEKVMKRSGKYLLFCSCSYHARSEESSHLLYNLYHTIHQSQCYYFNFFLTIMNKVLIKAIFPR